mmetsp:Transcript_66448/g.197765  ORF Transcript_66448/g.197765 Transcript_66448/m.197765 type:complete len:203 (-) Transcript_66448:543-1151(-)
MGARQHRRRQRAVSRSGARGGRTGSHAGEPRQGRSTSRTAPDSGLGHHQLVPRKPTARCRCRVACGPATGQHPGYRHRPGRRPGRLLVPLLLVPVGRVHRAHDPRRLRGARQRASGALFAVHLGACAEDHRGHRGRWRSADVGGRLRRALPRPPRVPDMPREEDRQAAGLPRALQHHGRHVRSDSGGRRCRRAAASGQRPGQ